MSKLRERMIEDMDLAGLSERTQYEYLRAVRQLAVHYGASPATLSEEQVRQYLVELNRRVAHGTFQTKYHGIKFFYYRCLGVGWSLFARKKIRAPRRRRMPRPITYHEFRLLVAAIRRPDYRLCAHLMYFCGLRISEAVSLRVSNIDSTRMVLRIIGKGNKEHYVPFPRALVASMRAFWKTHRNRTWLFPGRFGLRHVPASSVRTGFRMARDTAGIDENVTPHSLRHSYATRLLERGVDVGVVHMLLRHSSMQSTRIYMHLTDPMRQDIHQRINEWYAAEGGVR